MVAYILSEFTVNCPRNGTALQSHHPSRARLVPKEVMWTGGIEKETSPVIIKKDKGKTCPIPNSTHHSRMP